MNDLQRIKPIFEQALDRQGQDRRAYLDEACRGEPDLRSKVEALLEAHERAQGFLESPIFEDHLSPGESPLSESPGTTIGRYKLLEKIGEGGMAVVYMAEQTEPIRRKVALKIIKLGMDTRQVIARFEAERQALALMDHPSIAKVLDAGATETGRPYFVMELVQGVSITEYCDKNNLSTKDRLILFLQVCHAVQHAHQKGIIHRDIKPSNVMVTHHDGKPVPKVIDFGIAKATNQKLTERTLFTRYAHIIGTPAYMSPEQAELSDLDIDTRSDIYSLGVLLYELLTGTTPFSEEELRKAGYIEMQRIIREQEPARPSTKLSTLGETVTDIAKCRNATPDLLRKAIRGDLDWIAMKTLEKDRTRRYETASGLAEDIRRHLESEPVLARGPGAAYRLRKAFRRYRAQVFAALAIAVAASAVFVLLCLWHHQRLQTKKLQHKAILDQAHEQYARRDLEAALETIQSIFYSRYVGSEARLFCADILADGGHSEEAMDLLGGLLKDRREIAGAAHARLALLLSESGQLDAEKHKKIEYHRHQAEALSPESAEAYFSRAMMALSVKDQLAALKKALQLKPDHYASLRLRAFTYYASRQYYKMEGDALLMTHLRPGDPLGYSLRAVAWRELGYYPEAIEDYDRALARTPKDNPQYIDLSSQRCETLLRMRDYDRLIADARQCVKAWPHKPMFLYCSFCALTALGDYDTAITLYREISAAGHEAPRRFQDWCAKYVFDTLEARRSWHPPDREPAGAAFEPMLEAEKTHRKLSAKAKRVITDGFTAHYSPDGRKIAFSAGFWGCSGLGVYDVQTGRMELLLVPGKDPTWSPDGRYLAFVREREALPVPELAEAQRINRERTWAEQEVWIANADGTQPRRLAAGVFPFWSSDAKHIYYQSPIDQMLYKMSIEENAGPEAILPCNDWIPAMSSDEKYIAHITDGSFSVVELATRRVVAQFPVPFTKQGQVWSLDGRELCLGGMQSEAIPPGLWTYDLEEKQLRQVLEGPVHVISLSPDGTRLLFNVNAPYYEIWQADLDPNVSLAEALGPDRTMNEYLQDMLAFCTRRIETDPQDAYAYSNRAHCYDYLHHRAKAQADMKRWSAVMSGRSPSDVSLGAGRALRRVIKLPLDCELVLSAERPVHEISALSVAFMQKGRGEMKLFEVPMVVTSLLGFCFLSGLDVPPARADFIFGTPTNLGSKVNTSVWDDAPSITADGLSLFFCSTRFNVFPDYDLYVMARETVEADWGAPVRLGSPLSTPGFDNVPNISADGLTLVFSSDRPGSGDVDLWMTARQTKEGPWAVPVNLGPVVNSPNADWTQSLSADMLELYFGSDRPGGHGDIDLWVTRRATPQSAWGPPVNLGPTVNSPYEEYCPALSADGLCLMFSSTRPGGYGSRDVWITTRVSKNDPWRTPWNPGPPLNSSAMEGPGSISPDGSTLFFHSSRSGGYGRFDLWQVPIILIVDFNGDGKVDGKEVLAMAQHWGQDKSLYDIGPTPFGDGIVDANDLTILAGYIGPEPDVNDPTLIAHWPLDEVQGMVAANSASDNDLMALGNPAWQPTGGKIGGALAFDGKDDFGRSTSFVLDPSKGPFSVIAWVKGGATSRVIVSQASGADWLYLHQYGALTTDLMSSDRKTGKLLASSAFLIDDQWHRVVFTWDGTNRILGVDGVEVARDTQPSLAASSGHLHIGAGKYVAPATYWTGLIDDVRIYNRAVKP